MMKKIAVVYLSKYGHTKTYADWLKEEVDGIDVIALNSFNFTKALEYKLVIFACGIYGDKLAIMDNIKKNIVSVPAQKVMIMAVGWYVNDSEEAKQKLIADNFPEQYKGSVPLYIVNSGLDTKQLSVGDKAALMVARRSIEKKSGRSTDDINALSIIKGYADQTSKDNLASIKKGIEEFFDPGAKAPETVAAKPAPAKPSPAKPKPAAPAKPADQLSDSVEAAFKNLNAPKPAPKAEPALAPEPAPASDAADASAPVVKFNSKGEVVVSSVVAAINSLNNEDVSDPTNPISEIAAEARSIAAEEAKAAASEVKPAPKPAPAPAPEPTLSEDSLSNSVEEAFKHLNAPKPAPAPAPKPAVSSEDSLSNSVEEAFKHLNVRKPAPAPAPAPNPVVSEDSLSSSVEEAFKHLNAPKAAPKPAPAPKEADLSFGAEPAAEEIIHTRPAVPEPAPVIPEPAAEAVHEPAPAEESAPRKNSYMEMFAKRRRATAAETESAAASTPEPAPAPAPAPVAPAPAPKPVTEVRAEPSPAPAKSAYEAFIAPQMDFDLNDLSMDTEEKTDYTPAPEQPAIADFDMDEDVYDFIEDSKPTVSKRALNAVQDLAKAKLKAEQEAARLAAAKHAETVEEQEEIVSYQPSSPVSHQPSAPASYQPSEPASYQPAQPASYQSAQPASSQQSEIIEKMRHDLEALAVQSENVSSSVQETEYAEQAVYQEQPVSYAEQSENTEYTAPQEESSDGLEAFAFTDSSDYDLESEFSAPEPEPVDNSHISKTNLDIMKLQEEINASIESNRAAKEKIIARQKQKEEVYNPFQVQFDDDEDDKKKKKKHEPEHKRLDDPIDPDIFFSRQSNKGTHVAPGVMPEIKFRNH